MLFLFDIDGTLLRRMPPAHRQAICEAALALFRLRVARAELGETAGMTDTAIVRRTLQAAGIAPSGVTACLPAFFAAASAAYRRHVPHDLRPYHAPHTVEALEWLRGRGVSLGLVTGNIEHIAWTKLGAAGLAHYFACGAFGDEAEARDELPRLAVERAQATFGRTFAPAETYVVGDTPADIACGAACELRTIAVATGPIHDLDVLRGYGPDYAFATLLGLLALDV